jgi:hypothetical protein
MDSVTLENGERYVMHLERLEYELTLLDGKEIVIVIPSFGHISYSFAGKLEVTRMPDLTVGFHFVNQISGIAIIFFSDDVIAIEPPTPQRNVHIIRLKGPYDYKEQYQTT